jgi:hypothetical protein
MQAEVPDSVLNALIVRQPQCVEYTFSLDCLESMDAWDEHPWHWGVSLLNL